MSFFGQDPFIIAEVGSNWSSLTDCLSSISQAKACGADAVKFQMFTHRALYGFPHIEECQQDLIEYEPQRTLRREWLPKLKEKADAVGIEFMCSAFSPEGFELVDKFVNIHKIAMSESNDPLICSVVAATGKPAIISVIDIKEAVGTLCETPDLNEAPMFGKNEFCLLYGEPCYPSRGHNLFKLSEFRNMTDEFVNASYGLSDHSLDYIYAPLSAHEHFGASVIEKHVNFCGSTGPDAGHSITADEFQIMVQAIRGAKVIVGQRDRLDFVTKYRRRVIATRDITKGEEFSPENCGSFRSLVAECSAFSPMYLGMIMGFPALEDIKQGQGIGPKQFKC